MVKLLVWTRRADHTELQYKEESLPFLVRIVLNSQVSGGCCVEAIGLSSTRLEVWKDEGEQL